MLEWPMERPALPLASLMYRWTRRLTTNCRAKNAKSFLPRPAKAYTLTKRMPSSRDISKRNKRNEEVRPSEAMTTSLDATFKRRDLIEILIRIWKKCSPPMA